MSSHMSPPSEDEIQRLRARISELEEELRQRRSCGEEASLRVGEMAPSAELHKGVFDNISVCIFLVDVTSDGRFKFAGFNPAEEKAVGLTNAEVSGKFVEEVFVQDLAKKLTASYRRCVHLGTPIHYDDELDLPGGRRHFHSNLIPIRDSSSRISRIVGACIDTTDFKRSQKEAFDRQKLESLGILAAGIAHDFNNLFSGILAQSEVAATAPPESPPLQELQAIKGLAIRGSEIVREIMVYSGREETSLARLDLSRLVEEILELLKISISKRATLAVDLPKNLPSVRGNAGQLRRVVMNLITNASEALGEKQGVISVTLAKVNSEPDASAAGAHLRLEVRDTGMGMKPETVARIFDPFYSTKSSGRGLGLAVVQGIIRSHGGTINVVSAPGEGSQFTIILPCPVTWRL